MLKIFERHKLYRYLHISVIIRGSPSHPRKAKMGYICYIVTRVVNKMTKKTRFAHVDSPFPLFEGVCHTYQEAARI